jgi:hypothetical protein
LSSIAQKIDKMTQVDKAKASEVKGLPKEKKIKMPPYRTEGGR